MANQEIETDPWVDHQLTEFLHPDDNWTPNRSKALANLYHRRRSRLRRIWIGVPLATTLSVSALFIIPTTRACAQDPVACVEGFLTNPKTDFKQLGSATAPTTVEIYLDYECPPCAAFFANVLPALETEYVKTGKLELIFRDMPIARHSHARLAARYANAAGRFGYYQAAAKQIFATQSTWSKTGDIESQLAPVLPPAILQKVHALVQKDDAAIDADLALAEENHLTRTPSLVIVTNGKRQLIPGDNTLAAIKSYLQ